MHVVTEHLSEKIHVVPGVSPPQLFRFSHLVRPVRSCLVDGFSSVGLPFNAVDTPFNAATPLRGHGKVIEDIKEKVPVARWGWLHLGPMDVNG